MKKSQSKCCDWERFPCVKEGIASAYLNAGGEVAGTLGEMIRKRAYLLQGTASFPGLRGFWKRVSSRQKLGKQQGTEQLSGLRGLLTNQPVAAGPQPRMLGLQLLTPPHLRGKRCCARARACECVRVSVCECVSPDCQLQAEPPCSAYLKCSCREEAPLPGPGPPLPAWGISPLTLLLGMLDELLTHQ